MMVQPSHSRAAIKKVWVGQTKDLNYCKERWKEMKKPGLLHCSTEFVLYHCSENKQYNYLSYDAPHLYVRNQLSQKYSYNILALIFCQYARSHVHTHIHSH